MKQKTQVCRVALASVVLLAGSVISGVPSAQAAAQQPTVRADQKKWEYCSVTSTTEYRQELSGGRYYSFARISYHRLSGTQQETIEGNSVGEAMSKALAKLGEEGWEMTGVAAVAFSDSNGNGTPSTTLYFKRPR